MNRLALDPALARFAEPSQLNGRFGETAPKQKRARQAREKPPE
jgi:hypothetical protein